VKEKGFFRIEGGASPALVRRAIQEINREVGSSGQSVDSFKAKSFPSHPAITGLFNDSMVPHILQRLLGGDSPYTLGSGQLALRFPGDACPPDKCECSEARFEGVRIGLYPIVTFQYSSTTLYQVSYHIQYLFFESDNRI
jgi:hypothetical protein